MELWSAMSLSETQLWHTDERDDMAPSCGSISAQNQSHETLLSGQSGAKNKRLSQCFNNFP